MKNIIKAFWKQRYLHLMALPAVLALIIFCYLPMPGIQVAFRDYKVTKGVWKSNWIGIKYFIDFFADPFIYRALRNTLVMSAMKIIVGFPMPIIFALLLNELRNLKFKKVIQTLSYLPYFISWVVISVMITVFLSPTDGFVNHLLLNMKIVDDPIYFLGKPEMFWWLATFLDIWKNMGWGAIIYIAAISSVDQGIYEAAIIDGAGRFQRAWHITLASIKPTIVILLILSMGNLLKGANFDISFLLGNDLTASTSQILDTYVFKIGISLGRYSYATAVGLVLSATSFLLLFVFNWLADRLTGESFM